MLTDSCLTENGQYGFQSYSATGPHTVTVTDNEISDNDTANYTVTTVGCGCTGGAKFWETTGATITGNYVHNNASVGIWADTNNTGFDISDNYFADNYGEAITYEISYNASITDNTFVRNALGIGPTNPGFPEGAIYISESGSDPRVPGRYGTTLSISGNVFTDNWSGVVLWENANRYCGSTANTSTGACTLVDPSVFTATSCSANVPTSTPLGNPDYFDGCRWKTQNVDVTDNTFNFSPADIGSSCTAANSCGLNGIFSQYGTYPPYVGWVVPDHISNDQNDHFADNRYTGPWNFMAFSQGSVVSWAQWSSGMADASASGDPFGAQDAGSTYDGSAPPATTTTTAPPSPPRRRPRRRHPRPRRRPPRHRQPPRRRNRTTDDHDDRSPADDDHDDGTAAATDDHDDDYYGATATATGDDHDRSPVEPAVEDDDRTEPPRAEGSAALRPATPAVVVVLLPMVAVVLSKRPVAELMT